jgi:hypothetical protein
MNKEELNCYYKIWSIIHKTDLLNFDEKDELHLFLMKFKDENKELKEQLENASNNYTKYIQERDNKIDKAIKYLETNGYGYDCCGDMCYFLDEDNQKDLLEILKGDVDEN